MAGSAEFRPIDYDVTDADILWLDVGGKPAVAVSVVHGILGGLIRVTWLLPDIQFIIDACVPVRCLVDHQGDPVGRGCRREATAGRGGEANMDRTEAAE